MASQLDWALVATLLSELSPRPLVLVDDTGVIRLVNAAFERCLGWSRDDLVGERWIERCTPAPDREEAEARLREALAGSRRSGRVIALSKAGIRHEIAMEVCRVGNAGSSALIATFLEAVPLDDSAALVRELRYEISLAEADFGRLRWISDPSGPAREPLEGTPTCYETLHGARQPCEDCALRGPGSWPRTAIRSRGNGHRVFEMIAASVTPDQTAQVRVHVLPDSVLSRFVDARIEAMAERSGLSEREIDVLRYLVMGRSLKDIAEILGISLRTVKFHQANVVEKLGADSRADLMRLFL